MAFMFCAPSGRPPWTNLTSPKPLVQCSLCRVNIPFNDDISFQLKLTKQHTVHASVFSDYYSNYTRYPLSQ
jgi:hypothetical protein